MSYAERHSVTFQTAADGSATAFIGGPDGAGVLSGRVVNLVYTKTDFADGSTFTLTSEATGQSIWSESSVNASAVRAPRQPTHGTTGAAALYAAAGTAVNDFIVLAGDRIKIVIASGGSVKTGMFTVVMG
jgi:hypothetical protein